jgi:transposase
MIEGQKAVVLPERDSQDPEVTPKAKRRIFDAPYKKKILAEVEAAAGTGSIGEILRREGIYSSTLTSGRKERDAAVNSAFSHARAGTETQSIVRGEREATSPKSAPAGGTAQS